MEELVGKMDEDEGSGEPVRKGALWEGKGEESWGEVNEEKWGLEMGRGGDP